VLADENAAPTGDASPPRRKVLGEKNGSGGGIEVATLPSQLKPVPRPPPPPRSRGAGRGRTTRRRTTRRRVLSSCATTPSATVRCSSAWPARQRWRWTIAPVPPRRPLGPRYPWRQRAIPWPSSTAATARRSSSPREEAGGRGGCFIC
jgi:hypothetical protein